MTSKKKSIAEGFRAPPPPSPRGTPLRRLENGPGERVGIYFPEAMAKALRVRAAAERRSISDMVTDAVRRWLDAEGR